MIISASRRTDIPACYSEWFYNRLKEGYCIVSNPYNHRQVKRVDLSPEAVDGFVFWTKDPRPMMPRLHELKKYSYYFTFTITPYDSDIEPGFSDKEALLQTFKDLSLMVGREKVIWRYDPVIISSKYTIGYHIKKFSGFTEQLRGYTKKCVISFVDEYRSIAKALKTIGAHHLSEQDMIEIAKHFSMVTLNAGMRLSTCCEPIDLSSFGIAHNKCIDSNLLSGISGEEINVSNDKNQREACGCAASVDIGAYETCPKGCLYCYANHSKKALMKNFKNYKSGLANIVTIKQNEK